MRIMSATRASSTNVWSATDYLKRKFGLDETRLGGLDGLRAIALLMVFNVHFFGFYTGTNFFSEKTSLFYQVISVLRAGHLGVDLFFVVSGFLIIRSMQGTRPSASFLKKRAYRLGPMHFFGVFLYIFAVSASPSVIDMLANLFLLAPLIKNMPVYGLIWTLTWEWIFYLFIFLIARVASGQPLRAALLLTVLTVFSCVAMQNVTSVKWIEPGRFFGFVIGIVLFAEMNRAVGQSKKTSMSKCWSDMAAVAAIIGIVAMQVIWSRYALTILDLPLQGGFYVLVDIFFALLIKASFSTDGIIARLLSSPFLRFLGKISYSFYLVHISLNWLLLNWLAPVTSKIGMLAYYAITLTCSIVVSSVTYLLLEQPYFNKKANIRQ